MLVSSLVLASALALPTWANVAAWSCASDAPGGAFKVDLDARKLCTVSGGAPGVCVWEAPLAAVWQGIMTFASGSYGFVEFLGWQGGHFVDLKIYEPALSEHRQTVHHADLSPGVPAAAVVDPAKPFTPLSLEIRCQPQPDGEQTYGAQSQQ